MTSEYARFRDLRPKGVETNLFSYHLKALVAAGYVNKTEKGYTLSPKGLVYVDRVSSDKMKLRTQPKIITMLLVQNSDGQVLLQKRNKQPYINAWTLPHGKIHINDASVSTAATREAAEKLHHTPKVVTHVGDCYILVRQSEKDAPSHSETSPVVSRTLAHIVRFETDTISSSAHLQWVEPLNLPQLKLAPAVEQIVARAFFNDKFFFEEFEN